MNKAQARPLVRKVQLDILGYNSITLDVDEAEEVVEVLRRAIVDARSALSPKIPPCSRCGAPAAVPIT